MSVLDDQLGALALIYGKACGGLLLASQEDLLPRHWCSIVFSKSRCVGCVLEFKPDRSDSDDKAREPQKPEQKAFLLAA